jgi:hypothetical protein
MWTTVGFIRVSTFNKSTYYNKMVESTTKKTNFYDEFRIAGTYFEIYTGRNKFDSVTRTPKPRD